jgi:hypothetical protein
MVRYVTDNGHARSNKQSEAEEPWTVNREGKRGMTNDGVIGHQRLLT